MAQDWQLLGGNPAPGDVRKIKKSGQAAQNVVEEIDQVHSQILRTVEAWDQVGWQGVAAEKFRNLLSEISVHLSAVVAAHQTLATALDYFGGRLNALQEEATSALALATQASKALATPHQHAGAARNLMRAKQEAQLIVTQLSVARNTVKEVLEGRRLVPSEFWNYVDEQMIKPIEAELEASGITTIEVLARESSSAQEFANKVKKWPDWMVDAINGAVDAILAILAPEGGPIVVAIAGLGATAIVAAFYSLVNLLSEVAMVEAGDGTLSKIRCHIKADVETLSSILVDAGTEVLPDGAGDITSLIETTFPPVHNALQKLEDELGTETADALAD